MAKKNESRAPRYTVSVESDNVLYSGTYYFQNRMMYLSSDLGSKVIQSQPDMAETWAKQGLRELIHQRPIS